LPANPFHGFGPFSNPPRRLIITGASSGLGRALAISYAAPQVELALVGRNAARLAEIVAKCEQKGARAHSFALDVGQGDSLRACLRQFDDEAPVDLLVASAGILAGPPDRNSLDGPQCAASQIETNLLGVVHAAEAIAPAMMRRGAGQIAVVSSTAAYRGLPYIPAYSASKAGVRAYGEALRARLAPFGVRVSVIVPSFFESPMTDSFHGPKPMIVPLETAARRVRKGLDRGAARIVFPRRIALLMQFMDLLPARMGDRLLQSDAQIRPAAEGETAA
jgi:short-subunit dehydrogenase